jgi:hypothetical protein
MSKGGVADIVTKGDRLDKVLVEPKQSSNRPGDFRDELNMKNPVGDVIVPDEIENLGLVDVSAICEGMKDPIAIQRKVLPVAGADLFLRFSPERLPARTRPRGHVLCFRKVQSVPDLT